MYTGLHGLVVVTVLYLLWGVPVSPRPRIDVAVVYLMQKPSQPSPLDYMGA